MPEGLIGLVLDGRFKLLERIGNGAMSWVFRAEHLALKRTVVLKVLTSEVDRDFASMQRFVREGHASSRLSHPNIVSVFDFGQDTKHGLLFIVMEHIAGTDLGFIIERVAPMPVTQACEIMLQVLAALAAAHDQGVIHRDVKPSNILLFKGRNDEGEIVDLVKVCDFGLAKLTNSSQLLKSWTLTGSIAGTPLYMAPEQAMGSEVDARADVYSAGIILYEMLTGRPPFVGKAATDVLLKVVTQEPEPPSEIVGSIDPKVESVVLWALKKDRKDRCPSARVFRTALREFLAESKRARGVGDLYDIASDTFRATTDRSPGPAPTAESQDPSPLSSDENIFEDSTDLTSAEPREASAPPVMSHAEGQLAWTRLQSNVLSVLEADTEVTKSALYLWTHYGISHVQYDGEYPFWVQNGQGRVLGPCALFDAMRILQHDSETGAGSSVAISGDGLKWMTGPEFARRSGQEALFERQLSLITGERGAHRVLSTGSLGPAAVIRAFGRVTRERATGRLAFTRIEGGHTLRSDVHLIGGAPTFVFSSELSLQAPSLLVEYDLIPHEQLPMLIHDVVEREVSLEAVAASQVGLDVAKARRLLSMERLARVFSWEQAACVFYEGAIPWSNEPVANSIFAFVPELIERTMSAKDLDRALSPFLDTSFEAAGSEESARLAVDEEQAQIAARLIRAGTLEACIARARDARRVKLIAYALIEGELLIRRPP
jgi:serine/threonine protein kinase